MKPARSDAERVARELAKRVIAETALFLGTIIRVRTKVPAVALTFDDGPHPEDTPRMLDLLERHGARATFFVVGKRARQHPELLARMSAAGHAIGNHSWDHPSFRQISGGQRRTQIRGCAEAIGLLGARLFRPPFGEQSLGSRLDALRCGHRVVTWDVIPEDWRDDPGDVLVERALRKLQPGSIVLFHDTLYVTTDERFRDRGPTLAAVETLLRRLDGYRFVSVPELLRLGRPVRWHWYFRLPREFHRSLR